MTCTPQALVNAAICYTKFHKHDLDAMGIYLACQWANNLCVVGWTPATANAVWIDASGTFTGDLNTFNSSADLATVTSLNLNLTGIDSLTGLECLPLLNTLRATDNQLSGTLDLSVCPLLASVELINNLLENVNVSGLSNLLLLDVSHNRLPTTAVNSILAQLDANGANNGNVDLNVQDPLAPPSQSGRNSESNLIGRGWTVNLDEINWTPGTEVFTWTDGGGANAGNLAFFLANADFDTVTDLQSPGGGLVTSLSGLQGLIALSTLAASGEAITTFDGRLMGALTSIAIGNNPNLASLTFSGDTSLVSLSCFNCVLTTLDITGCASLDTLNCSINSLTSLNCSGLSALVTLNCSSNAALTTLTLTGCTALVTLDCGFCGLTSLNTLTLTNLVTISCPDNAITSLDVSTSTSLITLACQNNALLTLTVTGCSVLDALSCQNNSLSSLNVSTCVLLTNLSCGDNSLTSLNLLGCTILTVIDASFNSLNQAAVDSVLCQTDVNGAINGVLDISGNTAPGAAGLVCSGNLDPGKGWTVTHD